MTLVIAKRGASAATPGNTSAAFHKARELGADWVALDVRRTADGLAAVHPDAHLPDGRRIASTRADELPSEVPGLAEALEACESMGVAVEIKNLPGDPDFDQENLVALAVAGLIGAYVSPDRSVVSSLNVDDVNAIQAVDPTVPVALVCGMISPADALARALAHGMSAVHAYEGMCTSTFVQDAHQTGLEVFAWVVNEAERIRELNEMGVDGIITDHPEIARAVINPER